MTIGAKRLLISIRRGSRRTIFRVTSNKRFNSASTTACGTATVASGGSNAPSKAHAAPRKITINNHYNGTFLEPWNERRSGAMASRCSIALPAKWPRWNLAAPRPSARRGWPRHERSLQRLVGRPTDRGLRAGDGSHSGGDMPSARRIAWCESTTPWRLVLYAPGSAEPEILYAPRV